MPPRGGFTNPAPLTESAREARKSFYCELCGKGYSRMNEFEAHEGSYDHLHKKRLKEMKQMQRDPLSRQKALRAERRADEKSGVQVITIKPLVSGGGAGGGTNKASSADGNSGGGGGGFKKGGFKNAFGEPDADEEKKKTIRLGVGVGEGSVGDGGDGAGGVGLKGREGEVKSEGQEEESESEDEGTEKYDPRRPTGCWAGCPGS